MSFKKTATSQDVAKLAGVSQSAVSRCFTKGASISSRTKLRVLEAARKLKYKAPNISSNSVSSDDSGLVAVILPYVTSRYYPEVLIELHEALRNGGFRILLITTDDGEELDEKLENDNKEEGSDEEELYEEDPEETLEISKEKIKFDVEINDDIKYMPIFHPSYLLRNPSKEKGKPKWLTWQDLKKVKEELNLI